MDKALGKQLLDFLNTHKFTPKDWQYRHVNPSNAEVNDRMNSLVNNCISEILNSDPKASTVTQIINKHLDLIQHASLDTEEREFVYDRYCQLCKILRITALVEEFKHNHEFWLKNQSYNPEKHVGHTFVKCSCDELLELIVLEKGIGMVDFKIQEESDSTVNVKCDKCYQINHLILPAYSISFFYKNCLPI